MSEAAAPLFVSTFGTGRPILCLHGIESHGGRFIGLASRLPLVRVVAPDLPGHGRSPKTGPWTIERTMGELLPLLRSLGDEVVLLGHSYGGLLAWELARAAADADLHVAALLLVDPAIGVTSEHAANSVSYESSSVGHRWPDEEAALADFCVGRTVSGGWSAALDVAVALERDADGWLRPLVAGDAVIEGWRQMQAPLSSSLYRGPTLLIEAAREQGRFVSPGLVRGLGEQLRAELSHVVLDATHTIPSDYPDELAREVGDFLAKHPA